MGKFWGFLRIWKIVSMWVNRFFFFSQGSALLTQQSRWMCRKRGFIDVLIKSFFLWKCQKCHFRNVTSPRGDEHQIGRIFLNCGLIGFISTKKGAKSTIQNIKVGIKKFKCHQKIPWVRFAGNDITNYGLILNRNGAREQKIILMKKFNFFLESVVFKIRP